MYYLPNLSFIQGGSVTLASSDPFAAPIIDTQLLSHPFDRAAMAQAMVDAETLLAYVIRSEPISCD